MLPVKYCRQPWGALVLLLQRTWVTLMVKALVVAVLLDPKLAVRTLHCGEAWRYISRNLKKIENTFQNKLINAICWW